MAIAHVDELGVAIAADLREDAGRPDGIGVKHLGEVRFRLAVHRPDKHPAPVLNGHEKSGGRQRRSNDFAT